MIEKNTVLILGAGASFPYGFPLGSELRRGILELKHPANVGAAVVSTDLRNHPLFDEFINDFHASRLYSIDAFLATRTRFSDIGKLAIAAVLLACERVSKKTIFPSTTQDWYDYLWNRIAAASNWDQLDFTKLSVVTFNYDRSLETFLLEAVRASYGVTAQQAISKLQTLKIIHVYGDLGSPWPDDDRYAEFGTTLDDEMVLKAAQSIAVIPEARDGDPKFLEAQTVLGCAEKICFLGFGFDLLNLRRLRANEVCTNMFVGASEKTRPRELAFSCYGRSEAEAHRDAYLCGQAQVAMANEPIGLRLAKYPPGFFHASCLETLSRSLILG